MNLQNSSVSELEFIRSDRQCASAGVRPILIGIGGPSCSGKTSVARALTRLLPGPATVLGTDDYYLDLAHLAPAQRAAVNFDHPDQLDSQLLAEHLRRLKCGESVQTPIYDFCTHTRVCSESRTVQPTAYLIVEGLFVLCWPEVRDLLDVRSFIGAPDDVCLERRMHRDTRERGRSAESVASQFEATVAPGNRDFIVPSSIHADLVLRGKSNPEISAMEIACLLETMREIAPASA